jgi:hypothetical protein
MPNGGGSCQAHGGPILVHCKEEERERDLVNLVGIVVHHNPDSTAGYRSFLNSSTESPASRTIPPIVKALIGFARGIVRMRLPSVMTTCFPSQAMRKPAFWSARTAS